MFRNYIKHVLRNIIRHKFYFTLNLAGLTVGFTSSMLILLFVFQELGYDEHHLNARRIFRATYRIELENGYQNHFARNPVTWINSLENDFTEIERLVRLQEIRVADFRIGEHKFRDRHAFTTDPHVFEVFTFPLLAGDPKTALDLPNSVVLTERIAEKYFGAEDPMGREVVLITNDEPRSLRVTGVMKDLREQSHFRINFLISFTSPEERAGWAYVYLLLAENTNVDSLSGRLPAFIEKYGGEGISETHFFPLQPLTDIHLYSDLAREIKPNGDITYVYIYTAVALLLLILAGINFTNLATARSVSRAREVGIRKVAGAGRYELAFYFIGESLAFTLVAFLLSAACVWLALPAFSQLIATTVALGYPVIWLGFLLLAVVTGFAAGCFPAAVLSSFEPTTVLKSSLTTLRLSTSGPSMRRVLVILQFAISIGLMVATGVSYQQLQFLSGKKLGLNKEQIIAIPQISEEVKQDYQTLKTELQKHPGILGVTAAMEEPSRPIQDAGFIYAEGQHDGDENSPLMNMLAVDDNFIDLMEIELASGRNFHSRSGSYLQMEGAEELVSYINGRNRSYILNETAVQSIGWNSAQEAIGKMLSWRNAVFDLQRGPIIGVVKNFHFSTLRSAINPTVMMLEPVFLNAILVKFDSKRTGEAVAALKDSWEAVYPEYPLEYVFLDQLFSELYVSEQSQVRVLSLFSGLAIVIACLGIIGLAAFVAQSRTREIGVRKVIGASVANIVQLLAREFVILVSLASLIAWPLAYYFLRNWLETFAYRVQLQPQIFFLSGLLAILVALVSAGYQALKAAQADPVETLRYE